VEWIIKNGFVYDPLNNVKGEKMDIAIKNGKIVSLRQVNEREAKVVDASGMVVMAGGVDIHSHIAGSKVNTGRIMRPEDHYKVYMRIMGNVRRSGSGRTTPSTNIIGYKYARMGWTTVIEPATPPLKTRHTHEELDDIPIIDKACFPLLDSNWFILNYLEKGEIEKCAAFIAWILKAIKGYAIKIVDPGSAEAWGWGKGVGLHCDEPIPGYNLTPLDVVKGLCKANQILNLPHPIHVHCNRLGFPGNYTCTLETMDSVSGLAKNGLPSIHITHVQFTGYTGESWASVGSGGEEIAKYVNNNKHVTLDLGQVIFGEATTMTADAPFEFTLYHLSPGKWSNADVEVETSAGIVPYKYRRKNYVNTVQWTIGLEVALLVKDPWRVFMTTDHPNAGPFTKYPTVIGWLVSRKAREKTMETVNKRGLRKSALPTIDREYDLYEITILTRASPAKILGLEKEKGHLGVGADADVAIYNVNPEKIDLSKDYKELVKAFKRAAYTFKDGELVVKDGEIVKHTYGKTYYVNCRIPRDLEKLIVDDVKAKFKEWYSVSLNNYVIGDEEVRSLKPLEVESSLK